METAACRDEFQATRVTCTRDLDEPSRCTFCPVISVSDVSSASRSSGHSALATPQRPKKGRSVSAGSHVVDVSPAPDVSLAVAVTMSSARGSGAAAPVDQGSSGEVVTPRGESASHARTVSPAINFATASPARTMWKPQRVERTQDRGKDAFAPVNLLSPANVSPALATATVSQLVSRNTVTRPLDMTDNRCSHWTEAGLPVARCCSFFFHH